MYQKLIFKLLNKILCIQQNLNIPNINKIRNILRTLLGAFELASSYSTFYTISITNGFPSLR